MQIKKRKVCNTTTNEFQIDWKFMSPDQLNGDILFSVWAPVFVHLSLNFNLIFNFRMYAKYSVHIWCAFDL